MRNVMLAILALAAAGAATMAGSGPAAAEGRYCIQGGGWGYPGECSYRSYAQCAASLSGRYGTCGINPRAAYAGRERPYREYRRRYYRDY